MSGYNVSKGGIKILSQVLSSELAPLNIRVNSVSPAFIETNQTRGARENTTQACGELMQTAPPLGRIGVPEEVSPAVVFLLSEAAAYVTGADLLVMGGYIRGEVSFFFFSFFCLVSSLNVGSIWKNKKKKKKLTDDDFFIGGDYDMCRK